MGLKFSLIMLSQLRADFFFFILLLGCLTALIVLSSAMWSFSVIPMSASTKEPNSVLSLSFLNVLLYLLLFPYWGHFSLKVQVVLTELPYFCSLGRCFQIHNTLIWLLKSFSHPWHDTRSCPLLCSYVWFYSSCMTRLF